MGLDDSLNKLFDGLNGFAFSVQEKVVAESFECDEFEEVWSQCRQFLSV